MCHLLAVVTLGTFYRGNIFTRSNCRGVARYASGHTEKLIAWENFGHPYASELVPGAMLFHFCLQRARYDHPIRQKVPWGESVENTSSSYGVQSPPKIKVVCQHSMFANNIQLLVATSILVYIDFHLHTTQCRKIRFNFQLCDTTSDSKNESSNLKAQLRTLRR